jgi:RNA polymerase sigma-70 factor, ECF subfamily
MADDIDFENLVSRFYAPLYQFAFSLTRSEADACDLTQETFCIWAAKGHQLRDRTKVKTWLFTTLHREFLEQHRKRTRHPQVDLEDAVETLPPVLPNVMSGLDATQAVEALGRITDAYQAPVALFYLQDYSYLEIAEILGVPVGTVKSRLSRGLTQLQRLLSNDFNSKQRHDPSLS